MVSAVLERGAVTIGEAFPIRGNTVYLAVRLAVVTVKGALVKGFSRFLRTSNKAKVDQRY